MDQGARFPQVKPGKGHYESFYLKACPPGGGRGIWIRHTVHKRPGAEPNASIWFTFFDREAEGPVATKITVEAGEFGALAGEWIHVGQCRIGPGNAEGRISTDSLTASWNLLFSGDHPPCQYLPAEWLYRAPLPKTKFVAPVPFAIFNGAIELDGQRIDVSDWSGMIGHNWGSEHAERWVWLEGTGFEDSPDAWFDAGAARIKIGRWTSPWVPSGMLSLDGELHRLGGLGRIRSARIVESYTGCEFELPGDEILVRGRVTAPSKDFVAWVYADPKGSSHHTINCSVSDLELTVERPGRPDRRLSLPGGAAYELGMRETTHGVPLQPYADG
jgi:hypothetical protein